MNTYNISNLAEIIGSRPTWQKLLKEMDITNIFIKEMEGNQVVYRTKLSPRELKKIFNEYKTQNKVIGGKNGLAKLQLKNSSDN